MNKLIIDLEATCTDCNEFPKDEMEIIEIGAVLVNSNNVTLDEFTIFIKPVRNPILTKFCTKLTSITQEDVDSAPGFTEAFDIFKSWVQRSTPVDNLEFLSWGNYDKNQIIKDCEFHGVSNFLEHVPHINIKNQFAKNQGIKPRGLGKSIKLCGLEFEGNAHRGIDDARNMVRILDYIEGVKEIKLNRR